MAQIATKVEVFIAEGAQDFGSAAFRRLGYLSFDPNERSNHQARELKSVHVNVSAHFVKLVIHRCHVNKLNIYNQVPACLRHGNKQGMLSIVPMLSEVSAWKVSGLGMTCMRITQLQIAWGAAWGKCMHP